MHIARLIREHNNMKKSRVFRYARQCAEVAQELGVKAQTHPVPRGGLQLEIRDDEGTRGKTERKHAP